MKAVYAARPDDHDPLSALVIGERPDPVVPEGWVRVRVRAVSLNHKDLWTLRGVGLNHDKYPRILGCEAAGEDPDGRRVTLYPVLDSPPGTTDETLVLPAAQLVGARPGTLAEYIAAPAHSLLPVPDHLTWEEAACLMCTWLPAYRMLFTKAELLPGNSVLVQGAAGGLSTALIQLGAAAGLRVYATSRTADKRDLAKRLGAHEVFESNAELPEQVDAVVDSVGRATWTHSLRSVRNGGTVVVAGATTGDVSPARLHRIYFHQIKIVGSFSGTRDEYARMLALMNTTGIRPLVDEVMSAQDAHAAFKRLSDGDVRGNLVLTWP
ncbi:zinc-binding dehydrogenase [Streptomyces tanashiensis]|uniref:Zinc-binding dehydrogenase n=1 Tax=Streptomyces tanashiensis TaxID=67367 RepID=A0ABY6QVA2_9ACTN|nr:zinc-binding dehydrogenase [Streptomyces tanashiensis]UZX21139.1 zinc-binding dehydrogenase [Streptomyces tanashiensis]GGT27110.1 Zn-dependent oxidoreductase [Streptomyces tanashiensis]GGY60628.1 Zn-dependent oxidoreductase [Streptomyces tanashiensis]